MLTVTLRDLQFRRRQFAVAVLGAGLVFAVTLLLTGISAGFDREIDVTVDTVRADAWIVPQTVGGPFSADVSLPDTTVDAVRDAAGVTAAIPVAQFTNEVRRADASKEQATVIGRPPGGLSGHDTTAPARGHAVVSDRLDVDAGDTIVLGGRRLLVDRTVEGASYFAGVPTVYVSLADAQAIGYGGERRASAIVTRGIPQDGLPDGLAARDPDAIRADLRTPIESAVATIEAVRLMMWAVAALIIGAVTYLSALERVRDFAVLKAVGGSSRALALSLMLQAVLAALLAAVLASGLALLLRPAVTMQVVTEASAIALLFAVAILVGVLASFAALRRALGVDPALAFAG